jgi:hypothetical protein
MASPMPAQASLRLAGAKIGIGSGGRRRIVLFL